VTLTTEQLLLGGEARLEVEVPEEVLRPSSGGAAASEDENAPRTVSSTVSSTEPRTVILRPLRLADLQRIDRAARDSQALSSVLMVQQALVEPQLSVDEVSRLHAGLVGFLLRHVNRLSGLELESGELESTVRQPVARAAFVLAREFGWTPQQCAELTLGQVLLYLEMLGRGETPEAPP